MGLNRKKYFWKQGFTIIFKEKLIIVKYTPRCSSKEFDFSKGQ